jgi:hypothetical protein
MKLTKSFGQYVSVSSNELESELRITVDFDEHDMTVTDDEVTVESYNVKYRRLTDLTAIFNESLSEQLESMIQGIDWAEVWREQRAEKAA